MRCPASTLLGLGSALLQLLILGWDDGVRQGPCFSSSLLSTDKTPWHRLRWGRLVTRRALPDLVAMTEKTKQDETRPERACFSLLSDSTAVNEGDSRMGRRVASCRGRGREPGRQCQPTATPIRTASFLFEDVDMYAYTGHTTGILRSDARRCDAWRCERGGGTAGSLGILRI